MRGYDNADVGRWLHCRQDSILARAVRILTVGNMYPPHHYGGYELVWQSAVRHLRDVGHEVHVLTSDTRTAAVSCDPPYVHRELRWPLIDGSFAPLSRRERIRLARHNHRVLARRLREEQPDVVAWWSMGGLTLTMLESVRRSGVPAVAFVHDDWLDYGRWADGWLHMFSERWVKLAPAAERLVGIPARVAFGAAATYVFVSEHTRHHAESQGLGLRHTAVAHSGIHADFLRPVAPGGWRWRLLYVGRLDPRKGVDTLLEAMPHLPRQATVQLAGGWSSHEERRLRRSAERLGVASRVSFLGQFDRHRTVGAYGAADVVVFPVLWEEPWGLVPLEAMARGRPVVATGRGGSAEYLRDGQNCLLFPAGDAHALAAAVQRLAGDSALRSRLREGGLVTARAHTEANFNTEVEQAIDAARASLR